MANPKLIVSLLGSLSLIGALGAFAWRARAGVAGPVPVHASPVAGTPIVVELFSSEGCSSCPPAEAFLREVDRAQPFAPGVAVTVLEFHVDYWDYLGWKDPFSRHEFTERQESYAHGLGDRGIYTPEIIIQGHRALGSRDTASLRASVETEAAQTLARVSLVAEGTGIRVHVASALSPSNDTRDVFLAVTESELRSAVLAGENRGEDLRHAPIVRRLLEVGELRDSSFERRVQVDLDPAWKARQLRFIGFVQERRSRRILGAATL